MRRAALFIVLGTLPLFHSVAEDVQALQQQYLAIYVKINEAEHDEKAKDYAGALKEFKECCDGLMKIHEADPSFEAALVSHRMDDCWTKFKELQSKLPANDPLANADVPPPLPAQKTSANTTTEIWVPGNPTWKVNMTSGSTTTAKPAFTQSQGAKAVYPWREGVIASIFWIGENSKASAWDEHWEEKNNGVDTPQDRNGYAAGPHASGLNPFYVALPFNDLTNAELAKRWLPAGWLRAPKDGKPVSACKDRWVEIKNKQGDVCYAQWEDVGPGHSDEAEYVFGPEKPVEKNPGISISPAVTEYLGLGSNADSLVSWRFVDDGDVRPGAWLKLDEQAVLYSALHHQRKSAN